MYFLSCIDRTQLEITLFIEKRARTAKNITTTSERLTAGDACSQGWRWQVPSVSSRSREYPNHHWHRRALSQPPRASRYTIYLRVHGGHPSSRVYLQQSREGHGDQIRNALSAYLQTRTYSPPVRRCRLTTRCICGVNCDIYRLCDLDTPGCIIIHLMN